MTNEKTLNKIRALLAKTIENGCTEAEAMAAIEMARAMMDAYEVTEADLNEAKANYLLSGQGEPIKSTNLTTSLKTAQEIQGAELQGKEFSNRITGVAADNARTKAALENSKTVAEIQKLVEDKNLVSEHIEGAELDNRIKAVLAEYQSEMSEAELGKLLKEKQLIGEHITGQRLSNAIQSVRYKIEKATESSQIQSAHMEAELKELTWDRVKAEFDNYQQYQTFVDKVQEALRGEHKGTGGLQMFKDIVAIIYTTVTGRSGESGNLLKFVK